MAVLTLAGVLYLGVAFVHDGSFGLRCSIVEASSVGYSRNATTDYISPAGYFNEYGKPTALIINNGETLNNLNSKGRVKAGAMFILTKEGRAFIVRMAGNKNDENDLELTLGSLGIMVNDIKVGIQSGPMAVEDGVITQSARNYREKGAKNIVFVDGDGKVGFLRQKSWTLGKRGVSAKRLAEEAVKEAQSLLCL